MDKTILYPELVDYIFDYCTAFRIENENKASRHYFALQKSGNGKKEQFYNRFKEHGFISTEPAIVEMLKDGYESFRENVVTRIYEQHKGELNLNLCPQCLKIARTPQAKQCRFCFHSWHKKDE